MNDFQINDFKMDSFDFEMIYEIKRLNSPEETLKNLNKIWARRCGVFEVFVSANYIYEHLLMIIYDFNLLNRRRFIDFCLKVEQHGLSVLIFSVISMTEVKDLPGYIEWLKVNHPEEI